jgi:CNT family concentrative nucleoside transporter
MDNLRSVLGIFVIVGIAFLASEKKRAVSWRVVGSGLLLQLAIAFAVLKTEPGIWLFARISDGVNVLIDYNQKGAEFVFNDLAKPDGKAGFVFAFYVLPTVIFIGSLTSILYHVGILQRVVGGMAWVMARVMGVSGAESFACAANIFVGQTEAPLVVKPYVATMTRSELMGLMVAGFGTIAGGVLVAYVSMGVSAAHLITCSIMAGPASILMAKLFVPETETPETLGRQRLKVEKTSANVIDAAAAGATDGVKLAINVGGMLIAFVALVALLDGTLTAVGDWTGLAGRVGRPITLGYLLGWLFWPLAWVMGVPRQDVHAVASLLGTKVALTEFIAYLELAPQLPKSFASGEGLSPRAAMIASYALCGFANFASIAIQLGGIGALAENRRHDLARLGLKAMVCGALVTCLTASMAAALVTDAEAEYRHAEGIAAANLTFLAKVDEGKIGGDTKALLDQALGILDEVGQRNPGTRWAEKAKGKADRIRAYAEERAAGRKPSARKVLAEIQP